MTGIGEALEAEWTQIRSHLPHHQAVPTFTPHDQSQPQPEVRPVSFATELQHFLSVADEDMIRACNFLLSHPEGAQLISKGATVAGFGVPAGTITAAVAGLDAVLNMVAPMQQAAQPKQDAPAQPPANGGTQAKTPAVM